MLKLQLLTKRELHSRISQTGSINNVLYALIDIDNTAQLNPQKVGYSLGLGAEGEDFLIVKNCLGELCTTPNSIGVLTSGEENKCEFSLTKGNNFFSPFNVSLGNDFEEVYRFYTDKSVPMSELYAYLFKEANENPAYKGLISISMITKIEDFYGSLVKTSPLAGSLRQGEKIIDAQRFAQWFIVDKEPVYQGHVAVSIGLGMELSKCSFQQKSLERIFYIHPANVGSIDKLLHNHCMILPKIELPDMQNDYNSTVNRLLDENQVLDVKHILDNSTVTAGIIALNYIQEIVDL